MDKSGNGSFPSPPPPPLLLPPNTRLCCSQGTGLSPGPRSLIVGLGDRPLSIWGKERKKATENLLHCRNSAEHFILPWEDKMFLSSSPFHREGH